MLTSPVIVFPIDTLERSLALFAPVVDLDPLLLHIAFLDAGRMVIALRHSRWQPDLALDETLGDVAREALCFRAAGIIVARRQAEGEPLGTDAASVARAAAIKGALAPMHIILHDCIVIGRSGYLSMAEAGVL